MRGKTNVYQRTERLLISFSIKTKEGFDLRKKIRATLDEENILFSSDESKSTTIFKFESMYIKNILRSVFTWKIRNFFI